jgi:hypothetical protein
VRIWALSDLSILRLALVSSGVSSKIVRCSLGLRPPLLLFTLDAVVNNLYIGTEAIANSLFFPYSENFIHN